MYDGASAAAEAALMAMRITRRNKVAVTAGLHPHYAPGARDLPRRPRRRDRHRCPGAGRPVQPTRARSRDDVACVLVQQPAFLGAVEDLAGGSPTRPTRHGALLAVVVNEALSLALLRAPGDLGADIVCGEAQSFGVPMGFGGPAPRLPGGAHAATFARCPAGSWARRSTARAAAASC